MKSGIFARLKVKDILIWMNFEDIILSKLNKIARKE